MGLKNTDKIILSIYSLLPDVHRDKIFALLRNGYYKDLFYYVHSRFPQHDSNDMMQEVMLKIYQNIENIRKDLSIKAWINMIARNYCIDQNRKKKLICVSDIDIPGRYTSDYDTEMCTIIDNVLADRPDEDREIYYLYYHAALKIREISMLLSIPEGTIKFRLYNIRKLLKPVLEDYYEIQ